MEGRSGDHREGKPPIAEVVSSSQALADTGGSKARTHEEAGCGAGPICLRKLAPFTAQISHSFTSLSPDTRNAQPQP